MPQAQRTLQGTGTPARLSERGWGETAPRPGLPVSCSVPRSPLPSQLVVGAGCAGPEPWKVVGFPRELGTLAHGALRGGRVGSGSGSGWILNCWRGQCVRV